MSRLLDGYDRLLRLALTVLMGAILVPVSLQIFSRYVGLIPRYIWTEEVARFCFIWIIMIGSMIAVRDATHFDVDVLPRPRTERGRAIARLVVDGLMLVMALVFVRYGYDFAAFGWEQNSELTGINMISIHLVFPLAGATWALFIGEKIVAAIATLRRARS